MASRWEQLQSELRAAPRRWVVTGAAGFIGSNLVECLLKLGQSVVGLDNFMTGKPANLKQVRAAASAEQWARFEFIEGDICDGAACQRICNGADIILHQAALGSVPWSLEHPLRTHTSNVTGFLNMLDAARVAGVRRFVYASSSAVYGDAPGQPAQEDSIGQPLSPYAAGKWMNEIYAGTFARSHGFPSIGLRYFNVFGPRQDPDGAYAAVIPTWVAALLRGEPVFINGDGETSRDFCHVDNVVQANLLAGTVATPEAASQIYNVSVGESTTLNALFAALQEELRRHNPDVGDVRPVYRAFRGGDVPHSRADISKARRTLGYEPQFRLRDGLVRTLDWYLANLK